MKQKNTVKPLRLSKVGEVCVHCGKPAEVFDHVIPKRLSLFFDAGWNLAPSCKTCNMAKTDDDFPAPRWTDSMLPSDRREQEVR